MLLDELQIVLDAEIHLGIDAVIDADMDVGSAQTRGLAKQAACHVLHFGKRGAAFLRLRPGVHVGDHLHVHLQHAVRYLEALQTADEGIHRGVEDVRLGNQQAAVIEQAQLLTQRLVDGELTVFAGQRQALGIGTDDRCFHG